MKKIKVVNIITDMNIGGAGRMVENFAAGFDKDKFDICVILPAKSELAGILSKYGVTVIAFDRLKGRSLDIGSITHMVKLLKKLKPDIVHTHASFSSRIAARLAGTTKIVYTRHCVYPPGRLMGGFLGKIAGRVAFFLFTDLAIAVSPAAKENLVRTGVPGKRIQLIYNGVKPLEGKDEGEIAAIKREYGISPGQKVICTTGRLEEVKGHEFIIKAASKIIKRGHDIKVLIAGTGSLDGKLREMAKSEGISKQVVFTGFIEDVAPVVNIADIYVNASHGTEATSLSILEAMSLGKPVVATNYGGNPFIVEDGKTGTTVPVKDADALSEALEELLENKIKYIEYSKNALEAYRGNYTDSIMNGKIEDVYLQLCEKGVR